MRVIILPVLVRRKKSTYSRYFKSGERSQLAPNIVDDLLFLSRKLRPCNRKKLH